MTDRMLSHKGYVGSIETSFDDNCLYGRIMFVNDLVNYEGKSPDELKAAFIAAVDDYLSICEANGLSPDKPCSGTFNVRIQPDLHRAACVKAELGNQSLNEFVKKAIFVAVQEEKNVVNETHQHHHTHIQQVEILTEQQSYEDPGQLWQKAPEFARSKH